MWFFWLLVFSSVPMACVSPPAPSTAASTVSPVGTAGQGPSLPDPEVWLNPVDSTTGTGPDVVPRVVVMNSGMPLGNAVAVLERNISLRAWPSLAPVEFKFRVTDAHGTNPGEPSTIEVVPTQPLPDGWYVLALTFLPEPFRWPRFQPVVSDPRIGYGIRFRTSSSPFVSSVRVCAKENGKTEVSVDYSELLDAAAGVDASVAQGIACVPDAPSSPQGRYFGTITSVCNHVIDRDKPIDVRAAALLGAAGVHSLPFSAAIVPALMDPAGPGCRILRMPLPL